ncbi:hypothetical protein [Halogeometricum luteum]|jgi:hypothetical protein|uniref:Uncharacterized protein n=1 Tax=Halogeometricum luteum TaxID=2950537 RepID=A0ABU2G8Y3_9EURY|nr:hypothetical protein [Halogeometricum sp. S3BR5-2]MDS0296713.1 hypothetical protein [Halogeometricum sp. S3BR5-2]
MTGEDESERSQKLEELVRADLEQREDVTAFEFRDAEAGRIVAELEQEGIVETYLVTLEARPDGSEETHWSYLGESHEES